MGTHTSLKDRGKIAAPPDVLRWSPRSGDVSDCAIAALELACGVTYEAACAASCHVAQDALSQGLSWSEIRRAAKRLGARTTLLRSSQFDLESDDLSGILSVFQPHQKRLSDHVVYFWAGRIIEPAAGRKALWLDAKDFLRHYGYRAGSLLVIEGAS